MVDKGFTVAVFSGEVKSRLTMTAKCVNSINLQTHKNLQKILVNGGSPPHQTQALIQLGVDLEDWDIIDFPIDCMDVENNWNIHRWNGAAALHISTKEFFYATNDDDFLDKNFFSRISDLLNKYPSAKTAMGLRVAYDHNSNTFGPITLPKNKLGMSRPEFEPGINVVREIFFRDNLSYGPGLGFQPICNTELIREVGPGFFYNGFYPDCSPYFQIVSRFDCIFDSKAYMYWGIHNNQDHKKWDLNNYWYCAHERVFTEFLKNNLRIFDLYLPNNLKDKKEIKKYFGKRIVATSLFALTNRYYSRNFPKPPDSTTKIVKNLKFPFMKHLSIIFKRPLILFSLIIDVFLKKIKVLTSSLKTLII